VAISTVRSGFEYDMAVRTSLKQQLATTTSGPERF
jgi:hypothetical protein